MKMTFKTILLCFVALGYCVSEAQQPQKAPVITSVEPLSGQEGTIVTLKGRNFPVDPANSCILMGGLGAMACVEPNPTSTELKVRIGPIAQVRVGDVLMWAGTAARLHTTSMSFRNASLNFSETKLFRGGSPGTTAGVKFKLTKVSPGAYAGDFEKAPGNRVELGGFEQGPVIRVSFPADLRFPKGMTVDVDFLLKEPTLSIEFSAEFSSDADGEEGLRVIAKGITESARFIGEKVFADVVKNEKTGELMLFVTKPYLESGKGSVRFNKREYTRKK